MSPGPVLVAVVSWNTRDLLDACLRALRPDHERGRARVWVVDNGSTDGSPAMVRDRHAWARLLEPGENLGFGPAVNAVVRAAEPGWDWLVAANADTAAEPGALEALIAAGERDAAAGALAPRLLLPDGTTQHSLYGFPTASAGLVFNLGLHRVVPGLGDRLLFEGSWDPSRERRAPWAIAAFLAVRRQAWDAIGGFDDAQFMYAEDLDLGWRLRRGGWHTLYVPDARVRHRSAAATSQAWGDARVDRWQAATYAWIERRRGRRARLATAAVNTAGAVVHWALAAALARAKPRRWGWRRDEWRRWASRHRRGLTGP